MSSVRKQLSEKCYIVIKEVFFLVRNSFRPFKLKLPLFITSIKFAPLSPSIECVYSYYFLGSVFLLSHKMILVFTSANMFAFYDFNL